jgi:hypothetical protein
MFLIDIPDKGCMGRANRSSIVHAVSLTPACIFYFFWLAQPLPVPVRMQCCGSESEIIRMFWLDPNPKKKFGYGFRHYCRLKIFVKKQKSNTYKRKILCFSIENFFLLTYRFQNTYESN